MRSRKRSEVGVLSKKITCRRSQTMKKKVSRKSVMLSPTPDVSSKWRPGDVVDVFDKISWKMAVLSRVVGKNYFLVRLVGSSSEFKVSKVNIRERILSKHDACDKDCCNWDDGEYNASSSVKYDKKQRSRHISTNLGSNDADNVTCSIGSCSIDGNDMNEFHFPLHSSRDRVENSDCSYAESVFLTKNEKEEENLEAEIHVLELHAYRCTMEALHASGPLSWEKEELVTNLRLSLHISNDEHLTELRSLISANTSIPSR